MVGVVECKVYVDANQFIDSRNWPLIGYLHNTIKANIKGDEEVTSFFIDWVLFKEYKEVIDSMRTRLEQLNLNRKIRKCKIDGVQTLENRIEQIANQSKDITKSVVNRLLDEISNNREYRIEQGLMGWYLIRRYKTLYKS